MYKTIISIAACAQLASENADFQIWDCSFDLTQAQAGRTAFEAEHIAGAQYIDLDHDLAQHDASKPRCSGGRHPLPSKDDFAAWLGAIGVQPSTQIIVYDRNGCNFCGRAWWMLRWMGHERVAVLDGGLQAWKAASLPLESGKTAFFTDFSLPKYPIPNTEHAQAAMKNIVIDDVAKLHKKGSHTLIDARASARYRGEVEPLDPVAGHIPGALNRPFSMNLNEQGFFKSKEQLRTEFDALLAGRDNTKIIHHCGSGVSATPNVLAMEIAGYSATQLFAGSWSEWCNRSDLPVAQG